MMKLKKGRVVKGEEDNEDYILNFETRVIPIFFYNKRLVFTLGNKAKYNCSYDDIDFVENGKVIVESKG